MSEKKEVSEKMQQMIDLAGELSDLGHIGDVDGLGPASIYAKWRR